MPRKPSATGSETRHAAPDAAALLRLVRDDRIDAAIEAGLMHYQPSLADPGIDAEGAALLSATQHRLQTAWDARERHRARASRLARRDAEREARRAPPTRPATTPPAGPVPHAPAPSPATPSPATPPPQAQATPPVSSLPTGAAAILARAKAKAAARGAGAS